MLFTHKLIQIHFFFFINSNSLPIPEWKWDVVTIDFITKLPKYIFSSSLIQNTFFSSLIQIHCNLYKYISSSSWIQMDIDFLSPFWLELCNLWLIYWEFIIDLLGFDCCCLNMTTYEVLERMSYYELTPIGDLVNNYPAWRHTVTSSTNVSKSFGIVWITVHDP